MKGKLRLVLLLWMLCCFCTASFAEDESQKERIIFEENQPGGIKQGVKDGMGISLFLPNMMRLLVLQECIPVWK